MIRHFVLLVIVAVSTLAVLPTIASDKPLFEKPTPCVFEKITTLPLRETGYTISLPAHINGQALSLVMDTGSEGSLLTPEALARFSLNVNPSQPALIAGSDGRHHHVPTIAVELLELGTLSLTHHVIPLGTMPGIPMIQPPILGLLGMDILGFYDLEVDLPHQRLTLWHVHIGSFLCRSPPLWPDNKTWQSLPAHLQHRRFLVPFSLDGQHGTALLDSGARSHVISMRFAKRLGLTAERLARDPGGVSAGVNTADTQYHWHRFHMLRIGAEEMHQPVLTVAPLHEQADMLLGADWFTKRTLWLSEATGHIFIKNP